jgi:hypothetical protein
LTLKHRAMLAHMTKLAVVRGMRWHDELTLLGSEHLLLDVTTVRSLWECRIWESDVGIPDVDMAGLVGARGTGGNGHVAGLQRVLLTSPGIHIQQQVLGPQQGQFIMPAHAAHHSQFGHMGQHRPMLQSQYNYGPFVPQQPPGPYPNPAQLDHTAGTAHKSMGGAGPAS